MGKPQGVVTMNKIEEIYHPFVPRGFVWDPKRNLEIGINILRDKGASQSLILRRCISEGVRGPGSNNNEGLPSDCLVSYPGHSLVEVVFLL